MPRPLSPSLRAAISSHFHRSTPTDIIQSTTGISTSQISKMRRYWLDTGAVVPLNPSKRGRARIITPRMEEDLLAWLEKEKPGAELKDMVGYLREGFGVVVSGATVCRFLGRVGRGRRMVREKEEKKKKKGSGGKEDEVGMAVKKVQGRNKEVDELGSLSGDDEEAEDLGSLCQADEEVEDLGSLVQGEDGAQNHKSPHQHDNKAEDYVSPYQRISDSKDHTSTSQHDRPPYHPYYINKTLEPYYLSPYQDANEKSYTSPYPNISLSTSTATV